MLRIEGFVWYEKMFFVFVFLSYFHFYSMFLIQIFEEKKKYEQSDTLYN